MLISGVLKNMRSPLLGEARLFDTTTEETCGLLLDRAGMKEGENEEEQEGKEEMEEGKEEINEVRQPPTMSTRTRATSGNNARCCPVAIPCLYGVNECPSSPLLPKSALACQWRASWRAQCRSAALGQGRLGPWRPSQPSRGPDQGRAWPRSRPWSRPWSRPAVTGAASGQRPRAA